MIEVAHHIRKAYFDLLDGNIEYMGSPVNIYDELHDEGDEEFYVILSTQDDSDESTKSSFHTEHTITIDIVTKFLTSARKFPSENISDQILGLVLPTPQTAGLLSPAGLQITSVRFLGSNSLSVEQIGNYKVVRKILRFAHKCVQL
jgi:hypothetical protein